MYDEAIKFTEKFKSTRFDVICVRLADEVFRVSEGIFVVGAFGYLSTEFDSVAALIAHWITLVVLSVYTGNRVSFLVYGLVASRVAERWRMWVVHSVALAVSVSTAFLTRQLLDTVMAAKGAV